MIASRSGFREVAAFREKDGIFEADKKRENSTDFLLFYSVTELKFICLTLTLLLVIQFCHVNNAYSYSNI